MDENILQNTFGCGRNSHEHSFEFPIFDSFKSFLIWGEFKGASRDRQGRFFNPKSRCPRFLAIWTIRTFFSRRVWPSLIFHRSQSESRMRKILNRKPRLVQGYFQNSDIDLASLISKSQKIPLNFIFLPILPFLSHLLVINKYVGDISMQGSSKVQNWLGFPRVKPFWLKL